MKKKFKLQDLDCANCAAKMEEAIKRIEGVACKLHDPEDDNRGRGKPVR